MMPPPAAAELLKKVQLLTVTEPLKMAMPPPLVVAELPQKVELLTVSAQSN